MLTADSRASNPLTVSDLAPVRRMLGAHSMVIRVGDDGTLAPFEAVPELFLGRCLRRLLTTEVRTQFEAACRRAATTGIAEIFDGDDDGVMITPIFDDDEPGRCRFLVCWTRRGVAGLDEPAGDHCLRWNELELDAVGMRYRTVGDGRIEAAPWWKVGDHGIALWEHDHWVSSLGLAAAVMDRVVTQAVPALVDHPQVRLRLEVPAPEMLAGLLPVLHGTIRAIGVDPARIELAIPVEMAVDHDLLPVILHLRTFGVQIDIVGLHALTATLHTVSDTSDHHHRPPTPPAVVPGPWFDEAASAVADAIA